MDIDRPVTLQDLLAHERFVRVLARRLLSHDSHGAEDLAQDVWSAALERPPMRRSGLKSWLRTVALALYANRRRKQTPLADDAIEKRAQLEGTDAPQRELESLRRWVATAVNELREPYREVLLLRFYEAMPPREVARRLKRPVQTVHTQTKRGLAMLRATLHRDRERDPRSLLLLLAGRRERSPLERVGLSAAGALGVAGAFVALRAVIPLSDSASAAPAAPASVAQTTSAEVDEPRRSSASSVAEARAPVFAARSATETVSEPSASEAPRLLVDVLDPQGGAILGAVVLVRDPQGWVERGRTDERGGIELVIRPEELGQHTAPPQFAWVKAQAEGRATLLEASVDLRSKEPARVELALGDVGTTFSGRVVDRDSFPVPDARLMVLPTNLPTGTSKDGAVFRAARHLARTDAEGLFAIPHLAPGSVHVYFEHPELGIGDVSAIVAADAPGLDLRFDPGFRLHGTVRDASGAPAEGAKVWTVGSSVAALPPDWMSTTADGAGRFALSARADESLQLWAQSAQSHAHSTSQIVRAEPGGELEWAAQLREWPPLRIRLVDRTGAPVPEWLVRVRPIAEDDLRWTADTTDADGLAELILPVEGPVRAEVLGPFPGNTRSVFASASDLIPSYEAVHEIAVDPAPAGTGSVRARFAARGCELPTDFVVLLDPGERSRATRTALGLGGVLEIDGLAPGTYSLFGEGAQAWITEVGTVEVTAGRATDLGTRELDPPGRLDLSRLPAELMVQVWLNAHHGGPRLRWSGTKTEAESLHLLPGRYLLRRVEAPNELSFEVTSGALIEIGADFSLR